MKLIILGIVLYVSGFSLMVIYTNWQAALGIFLLLWATNVERIS